MTANCKIDGCSERGVTCGCLLSNCDLTCDRVLFCYFFIFFSAIYISPWDAWIWTYNAPRNVFCAIWVLLF